MDLNLILKPLIFLSDAPRWFICSVLGSGFLAYYYCKIVKPPILACSSGKFRIFLETHVPVLQENFWPTIWCFESRMQTVFASFLRSKPEVPYVREVLKLSDGGQVGLDWAHPEGATATTPIVIILPGLTGASTSSYVRGLVQTGNEASFRCVVFNNRGIGGISLTTPLTYCASKCHDIIQVIHHVKRKYPDAPLAATGISMGGLILGNYLVSKEQSEKQLICAAMLISVPFDVFKAYKNLETVGLNLLLNKHLANCLCRFVESLRDVLDCDDRPWKLDEVLKSRTVREFDSSFTSKQFGYDSVQDYYEDATLHDKLARIETPVLCLNAADDPFQPLEDEPVNKIFNHEKVGMVITHRGGHIGFMEGFWPVKKTNDYMNRVYKQFFTAMFKDDMYKEFAN